MTAPSPALLPVYRPADLKFARGDGAYLYTEDDEAYLDFASGIAVTNLGHNHPKLVAALKTQADKLWHTSNLFRIPGQERLAERLTAETFANRVFFGNSGAEANEAAIKIARRYHAANGDDKRRRIVAFDGAFHGRTLATLAAAGARGDMDGFGPAPGGFDQLNEMTAEAVRAALTDETAAILIEPVQGEGGVHVLADEFLRELRAIADEAGVLLIYDEVQCGMGRTGKLFAYEWSGAAPDIMSSAKGLGGGFPIGACLATEKAASGMTAGTHGSTFGGNPLATAVAAAAVEEIARPAFLARVEEMGALLSSLLDDLVAQKPALFAGHRGRGLMRGLECKRDALDVVAAARKHKLLAPRAKGNVLRLLPPLIVEEGQIREAIDKLASAADDLIGD